MDYWKRKKNVGWELGSIRCLSMDGGRSECKLVFCSKDLITSLIQQNDWSPAYVAREKFGFLAEGCYDVLIKNY